MRLFITCDINWESRVNWVLDTLYESGYVSFFEEQIYGSAIDSIVVVVMCRNPDLNFKQRIRFSKKEKKLYLDIMLDFKYFVKINQKEREQIVVNKLITEVPLIISKYKFKDFNLPKFEIDFRNQMSKIL